MTGHLTTTLRSVWTEFKTFALSGNMFDLALGFIIGTAFSKLVDSLAGDVIMQGIAAIFGKPDFRDLSIGPVRYGVFLTELLNFILLAAVLFMFVKLMGRIGLGTLTGRGGTAPPETALTAKKKYLSAPLNANGAPRISTRSSSTQTMKPSSPPEKKLTNLTRNQPRLVPRRQHRKPTPYRIQESSR